MDWLVLTSPLDISAKPHCSWHVVWELTSFLGIIYVCSLDRFCSGAGKTMKMRCLPESPSNSFSSYLKSVLKRTVATTFGAIAVKQWYVCRRSISSQVDKSSWK
jgi:hypothetical protein